VATPGEPLAARLDKIEEDPIAGWRNSQDSLCAGRHLAFDLLDLPGCASGCVS
jgi:hypothetical protein